MSSDLIIIQSSSESATRAVGARIGRGLRPGDVVALVGPLGAGKTQLVKGIAAGAGVADPRTVNSPTFVIVNEYAGRLPIFHVDAFRLDGAADLAAIGFDELCSEEAVVVIEWADRVANLLPEHHLAVRG